MKKYEPIIEQLVDIVEARNDVKEGLELSIQKAALPHVSGISQYYEFLNHLLTKVPKSSEMGSMADEFHFLISQSPENILKKDPVFRNWLIKFSQSFGAFLDTSASAGQINSFIHDPKYHIEDYDPGPSGWLTFNQFFTRHVKPGRRPVDEPRNDNIIVAPADSVFKGSWPIDEHSTVSTKGVTYSIGDLLDGSPYAVKFRGGTFTHSYLDTTDYHRFHLPVRGAIKELRKIQGDVIVNTVRAEDGSLITLCEVGFQFGQARGLVIVDSAVGLVAVVPVGMGHVSSVTLTAEPGMNLDKGQEFGYFAYGGSDMVMLFQVGRVKITAEPGQHYKQGEKIAVAKD